MEKSITFEQVVDRGCGIDMYKKVLVATIRDSDLQEETRSFDSFTETIEQLKENEQTLSSK